MDHIGISLHPNWEKDRQLIEDFNIKSFQLMTHDTKTGNVIWTPEMLRDLRGNVGQDIRLYAHSVFKIVLGKPYTYHIFNEHFGYACDNNINGYVVHIPANMEVNFCISIIVKLLKLAHKKLNRENYPMVYFEHVPSEYYSANMHIFGKLLHKQVSRLAIPVGLCIDTCHLYASGISFADIETVRHYMLNIQSAGLPVLIHLNDSVGEFASFVDRHDVLGAKIWKDNKTGLKFIKNPPFPKILEISDCRSSLELLAEL
jgi:hypothetical protein